MSITQGDRFKATVEITKAAVSCTNGNIVPIVHSKEVAEFIKAIYDELSEISKVEKSN